ncbi:MAG: sulfatase-like hydrolase/transferase [Halioglobus sp.]|nr:sulfatase-like hydrolase/transferase [Halioglobus sp.]
MLGSRPSILDDNYSKALILLAVLFFAWITGLKNFISDWTSTAESTQPSTAPNILLIVVDDLGYDDTSAINPGGLATPNMVDLAQQGVAFRRHYADATCTPSRVGILTGRYPERSGFRPVGSEIPQEFSTIAEELRDAGYATYLTGKWHAGEEGIHAWPQNKGFNQWFGFLNQWELSGEVTQDNMAGKKPTYKNPMLRENGGELKRYDGHLTDILTAHTVEVLGRLNARDKPWFLYHAFLAPHQPIQPAERFAKKFPNTPEGKYTALVSQLDEAIGQILNAVDRQNTIVVLVSDNGGTNLERDNNFPFFGKKSEMYEGAFRTPLILSWPGSMPEGKFIDDIVMNVDIYPTLLAAARKQVPTGLDGENLWPLIVADGALKPRSRSWEVFNANVSTLSFSLISPSGGRRLSSSHGLMPSLFQLADEPSGETNRAAEFPKEVADLTSEFWREHWRKSLIDVAVRKGGSENQTLYTGFDAMRTPHRFGFSIGLELGPLPSALTQISDHEFYILAGQEGIWELRFKPNHGLEWRIGDSILRDASFEPALCNAVILTGYFEPKLPLTTREPQSKIKLFSTGLLRDSNSDAQLPLRIRTPSHHATFVNYSGTARFSNMMLSSFAENYAPRLVPQHMDTYTSLYREQKLSLADVKMMNSELCQ